MFISNLLVKSYAENKIEFEFTFPKFRLAISLGIFIEIYK